MNVSVDTDLILSEYAEVKNSPSLPEYKTFVGNFIEKIEVGKYIVNITLKTGLGIYHGLDTTFDVRRRKYMKVAENTWGIHKCARYRELIKS